MPKVGAGAIGCFILSNEIVAAKHGVLGAGGNRGLAKEAG